MNPLLISPLSDAIGKVFDRLWPDPAKRAAAEIEYLKMQQAGEFKTVEAQMQIALGQIATNQADANSGNAYSAGWRPTIGYICALGLAYQYLIRPLLIGIGGYSQLPALDGTLIELVFGILGLAGLRTIEKIRGVSS